MIFFVMNKRSKLSPKTSQRSAKQSVHISKMRMLQFTTAKN
jgi:hypothetical protein